LRQSDRGVRVCGGAEDRPAPTFEVIVRTKPMVRRFLKAILMIPAFAVLVALAIANHQPVTVSFNPFDSSDPDLAVTVPLYLVGFAILIAGVAVGGIAAWLKQGRRRRIANRLAAENVVMRSELASLKGQIVKRDGRSPRHPTGSAKKTLPAA
jgi:hypothetical protein